MSNIPFKEQKLPPNHLAFVQASIAAGDPVAGDDLLRAIEQITGAPLPEEARNFLLLAVIPAVKRRGRPPSKSQDRGREDFAMKEVDDRYPALLQKHEQEVRQKRRSAAAVGTVLASAEPTPSELAYTEILQDMQADFPNIDWRALRNKHSAWNNGHLHPAENDTDSEDFDAATEQLYPRFKKIIKNGRFSND
jgi:hypothetical protein